MIGNVCCTNADTGPDSSVRKGPVTQLVEKCAALEQACAEYKDQYVRSLADFENYRKRVQREFEVAGQAGMESVVCELLPVLDSFDRALTMIRTEESEMEPEGTMNASVRTGSEPETSHPATRAQAGEATGGGERVPETDGTLEKMKQGIALIRRQLYEALARHGVEEFSCLGEEFDPRKAEAVSFIHSDEHRPDTVVAEQCKGFSCRGRVIRPARVVVARQKKADNQ